jgi:large subunit ribosomal protein L17
MRHRKHTAKLGRTGEHRNAMLANLVCSLIKKKRVTTTLAKAKAARPVAEKILTLGKKGTLHARRLVAARLRQQSRSHFKGTPKRKGRLKREKWRRNEDVVRILFEDIAPVFKERHGGYTRIVKLHQRPGDAAQMAILEWVDYIAPAAAEPVKAAATPAAENQPTPVAAPAESTQPAGTAAAEEKP